jgi:hypothetical protein
MMVLIMNSGGMLLIRHSTSRCVNGIVLQKSYIVVPGFLWKNESEWPENQVNQFVSNEVSIEKSCSFNPGNTLKTSGRSKV